MQQTIGLFSIRSQGTLWTDWELSSSSWNIIFILVIAIVVAISNMAKSLFRFSQYYKAFHSLILCIDAIIITLVIIIITTIIIIIIFIVVIINLNKVMMMMMMMIVRIKVAWQEWDDWRRPSRLVLWLFRPTCCHHNHHHHRYHHHLIMMMMMTILLKTWCW